MFVFVANYITDGTDNTISPKNEKDRIPDMDLNMQVSFSDKFIHISLTFIFLCLFCDILSK